VNGIYYSPNLKRFWETEVQPNLIGGQLGKIRFGRILQNTVWG